MLMPDGSTVIGVLYVKDFFTAGGDEVPVFHVRTATGDSESFADAEHWRFVSA